MLQIASNGAGVILPAGVFIALNSIYRVTDLSGTHWCGGVFGGADRSYGAAGNYRVYQKNANY